MRRRLFYFLFLVILITQWQCAHQVMPTGGPKDTKPPEVTEEDPPNGSTLFTGNRFTIRFNEFVELDQINKQLLISPPMVKKPDFHLKGKSLEVKFNEPLKPNTTYSVYFGNAIVDITEKNPLKNYTYIFSTGTTIDSLELSGNVVDAFDLQPVEDAYVMLYRDNNDTLSLDSLPLFVKPYYLSKTDKQGDFRFKALAADSYLVFGLKDENNSLTYDQPQEQIAFIDSLVKPVYVEKTVTDTLPETDTVSLSDSAVPVRDTLQKDTLILNKNKPVQQQLLMFVNEDTVQKLLQAELRKRDLLRFVFALPDDSGQIAVKNAGDTAFVYAEERSPAGDTILWFLKEPHPDTVHLLFFNGKDTLEKLSLRAVPKVKHMSRARKKEGQPEKKKYLGWKANVSGVITPGRKLQLTFDQPVAMFNPDSVLLVSGSDSLYAPDYFFADSLHRKIVFPFPVKEAVTYRLIIPDSSVTDWNGGFNQKITLSLQSKELKSYGKLTLTVVPAEKSSYILQLLSGKEKVAALRYFTGDTVLVFNYLKPGKYRIKVIYDRNGNRRWDTGNYFEKRQPEKVRYYSKELDIKANWEYDERWILEK